MILRTSKRVEDINCINNNQKFLCQIDACNDTSHKCPSSSAHSEPPHGYVYISQTGKYYRPWGPGGHAGTFLEGLEKCQSGGGTLIEFRTDAEHNVLKQMQGEYNDPYKWLQQGVTDN